MEKLGVIQNHLFTWRWGEVDSTPKKAAEIEKRKFGEIQDDSPNSIEAAGSGRYRRDDQGDYQNSILNPTVGGAVDTDLCNCLFGYAR